MALYQGFEPELKFFGTMNGTSEEHTNAFFCPDDETIVLIDMSLLNMRRASFMIHNMPNLKHFYACVTHTHYDHCSGFGEIAFMIKHERAPELLTILTDQAVADDVVAHLDSSGLRPYHTSINNEDEVYRLFSYDEFGGTNAFYDKHGHALTRRMRRPDWFVRTMVTTHSPRLKSCGFVFRSHGKLIVYTGDTNDLVPWMNYLRTMLGDESNHENDPPVEFYLDAEVRKTEQHLCFKEVAGELEVLLDEYPTMKLILMHYDDSYALEMQVKERLSHYYNRRVFIAHQNV